VWRRALEPLRELQFVSLDSAGVSPTLRIRKEVYFERVIVDEPSDGESQLILDLRELNNVLAHERETDALVDLGNAFYDVQRYDKAIEAYDHAIDLDPTLATAWYNKGLALDSLQRYDEAAEAYREGLKRDGSAVWIWRNLADVQVTHLHRPEEALHAIQQAVQDEPESIRGWAIMGDVEAARGHRDLARAAYERALALPADDALGWYSRGRALIGLERYPDALDALNQALALDSENADAWHLKARALRAIGWDDEADEAERRANEL